MEKEFSKLIMHRDFKETIEDVRKGKIHLGSLGTGSYEAESEFDLEYGNYEIEGISELQAVSLDARKGQLINEKLSNVVSYDESILRFSSLEGDGVLTSHTIVRLTEKDYLPSSFVAFHFYTRSAKIANGNKTIRLSENPSDSINGDYSKERTEFLTERVPKGSILLVDGPLLGKNLSAHTVKMNHTLLEKGIFPIFIVKNSTSNLVTSKVDRIRSDFNSDLHWAFWYLHQGQRTNFFLYRDKQNRDLSKYFCYIRPFNKSPQRVEIHPKTFETFKKDVGGALDLLYYYFIANGKGINQQVRPIVIAEKFARKTLAMFDLRVILKYTGLTPTVNEERF